MTVSAIDWVASGIALLAFLASAAGLMYARSSAEAARLSAEQARRSADAAERSAQAGERAGAAAEAMIPPLPPPVAWSVEGQPGTSRLLRNIGMRTATGLSVTGLPVGKRSVAALPTGLTTVKPGGAVEFSVLEVAELPSPHSLVVRWNGTSKPAIVPL